MTFLLVTFPWLFRGPHLLRKTVFGRWLFRGPQFGQILRVLALEKSSEFRPPKKYLAPPPFPTHTLPAPHPPSRPHPPGRPPLGIFNKNPPPPPPSASDSPFPSPKRKKKNIRNVHQEKSSECFMCFFISLVPTSC